MTGDEFRAALRDLGMTQHEFAVQAGLFPSSITRWVQQKRAVPGLAVWVIRLLQERKAISEQLASRS